MVSHGSAAFLPLCQGTQRQGAIHTPKTLVNFTEQLFMVSAHLAWPGLHIAFAEANKQPQIHSDSWHAVFQECRPGHTRTCNPAKACMRGPLRSQLSKISQPASNCSLSTYPAPSLDLAPGDTERNQAQSLCLRWTDMSARKHGLSLNTLRSLISGIKEPGGKRWTAELLGEGET